MLAWATYWSPVSKVGRERERKEKEEEVNHNDNSDNYEE